MISAVFLPHSCANRIFRMFKYERRLINEHRIIQAVSAYLRGSSFDELIELDRNRRIFKSIVHTPKKYSLPLSEITYSELLGSVSEILLHPEDRKAFVDFLSPDTLARRLGESEFPGLICGQFRFSLLTGGWCWTELAVTAGKQF